MPSGGQNKTCQVCVHESRLAIEQAILNGKPKAAIARTFGFTYTRSKDGKVMPDHKVIARHADRCMAGAYQKAVEERENQSGVAIAARLAYLDEQVDLVITKAREGRPVMVGDVPLLNDDGTEMKAYDWRLLLAAVREGRSNAELVAKLSGRVEHDAEDLDAIRRHLDTPEARKLLARLEELAATQQDT